MNETIIQAAALIVPMILAIVFHEVAHGLAARALGDPTAAEMKRLSLNPLRHVDPMGTVILPGLLALAKMPVFGWAKPVPVNFRRLRNPRRDMMLVAAAGPGMNLVMAAVGAVLLGLFLPTGGDVQSLSLLGNFVLLNLANFIMINVFLALFNLLPIPPFDGSHILEGLLPDSMARTYGNLRKYGMLLVILLIVVLPYLIPGFNPVGMLIGQPVSWLTGQYLDLAQAVSGR
ncbi:site-2 protease family protein [Novosphingobium sp.]|uniref:site-2 protease family protein n=1 Tax=Novosphingobium sp. TaxID=1874826 RepID=UPI0025CCE4D6|nr:site-2 protease family protein [Novosphingobium sp.]MCC6925206.1 site-2 protease family protein [Novosphingobium sp.]